LNKFGEVDFLTGEFAVIGQLASVAINRHDAMR
jgi:hypothetical protein